MDPAKMLSELFAQVEGMGPVFTEHGVAPARLAEFESEVRFPLPADYRRFLEWHDGQRGDSTLGFAPGRLRILALQDVLTLWRELTELKDHEFVYEYEDDDRIRTIPYSRNRIPIACYEIGVQFIFLDFIPGPQGRSGQLIFNPDEASFFVLANDFSELLALYERMLLEGSASIQPASREYGSGFRFVGRSGRLLTFEDMRVFSKT